MRGRRFSRRAPPSRPLAARRATAAESRLPAEARGGTLLTMERTVLGDGGRTVEFDSHPYRASGYPFEMTLTAS